MSCTIPGNANLYTSGHLPHLLLNIPTMISAGLGNIDGVDCLPKTEAPIGAFARLQEASMGKDTTIGHWEIAGIISDKAQPTYPDGFPSEVMKALEEATGKEYLGNKPYSGTDVIRDYGEEHMKTGKPKEDEQRLIFHCRK